MKNKGLNKLISLCLVLAMVMTMVLGMSVTAHPVDGSTVITVETNRAGYICAVKYSGLPADSIPNLRKLAAGDFALAGTNSVVYTTYVEGTSLKLNLVPFLPAAGGYSVTYTGSLPLSLDFSDKDVDATVLSAVVRPTVSYQVMQPSDPLHLGPNIIHDPDSPTGYTVKFLYGSPTATSVQFNGDLMLRNYSNPSDTTVYSPFDYKPGMMRTGAYKAEMQKLTSGDWAGYWYTELPLAAGANQYWFYENGVTTRWYPDPANPPIWGPSANTLTKRAYNSIYVPYDSKQNFEPLAARAASENPRTDGRTGTVTWEVIPGTDMTRYIGVYLPYGYDPQRTKPYKTIYMTPAYDQNESDFFGIGSCQNIMDNLLANGQAEDAVIITTTAAQNNTFLGTVDNGFAGLYNSVIPYVESHFNVSTKAADRAIGGHYTTAGSLINYDAMRFGYYLMLSTGSGSTIQNASNVQVPRYFFSNGYYEGALNMGTLPDTNAGYIYYKPAGGHDFNAWNQAITEYYKDLWKPETFVRTAPTSVLTTQADKVQAGQSFDVATSITANTNAVQLNYTFDATKFEYVGLKTADGVSVLNSKIGDGSASFTLMIPGNNARNIATLTLRAKVDAKLRNEWQTVNLAASCVLKDVSGDKSIVPVNGSASFTTIGVKGDTNADGNVDLIDLSNLIDWFGITSADSQWHNLYTFFDYNNNSQIDISEIALVAEML